MTSREWNYKAHEKVLSYSKVYCPLCKEPFRVRATLRKHLSREHTIAELEKFLRRKRD